MKMNIARYPFHLWLQNPTPCGTFRYNQQLLVRWF